MSINRVNTTTEEKSFTFLDNQSSILHTVDTNKITVNGVNVIVEKPKRGDVMCITHYKDENNEDLSADKQKVVWIDGLSINPKQLSKLYEPVGICMVVNGNKALVRYKEERNLRWATGERWELKDLDIIKDGNSHTFNILLGGIGVRIEKTFSSKSRAGFVYELNRLLKHNYYDYSVELVELDTDLPANNTTDDTNRSGRYYNRIVVNARFTENAWNLVNITVKNPSIRLVNKRAIGKHIKAVNFCYRKNGFTSSYIPLCRAKVRDWVKNKQKSPTKPIETINYFSEGDWYGQCPVKPEDFANNGNCTLLRNTFASYDEYFNSTMEKFPCGAGGSIAEFPCGKENTYKLANCTYLDNSTGKQEILYPAANYAASISLNAPKLGKGNWWLPSTAEMVQMMRDITYGTSFWDAEPDIINRVIKKLVSAYGPVWSWHNSKTYRWTSSRYDYEHAYFYNGDGGYLSVYDGFYASCFVSPITIYEF